ncbi:MAG TPA: hypothetical protein VN700_14305 [Vicinamibacterales bacterium]|nr:hypothetical protein [Vicinamibacterales bacterium]
MKRILLAACIGAIALALTSCTKTEAKTPGPAPISLKVPEPPARLNIPVSAEPPPPPPPSTEKPTPPTTPPARTPRATPAPTPVPAPTPPPATGTEPPPVVQTSGDYETRARERLAVADQYIAKVQRGSLGRAAQEQYDSAQRFIKAANDALKLRNFVYAAYCADKAATLAVLLVK